MGVSIYSFFPLVDTILYLLTIYRRSDITDARPYVTHIILHNHLSIVNYAYTAQYNRVQCKAQGRIITNNHICYTNVTLFYTTRRASNETQVSKRTQMKTEEVFTDLQLLQPYTPRNRALYLHGLDTTYL
jgi:hypothetical protein